MIIMCCSHMDCAEVASALHDGRQDFAIVDMIIVAVVVVVVVVVVVAESIVVVVALVVDIILIQPSTTQALAFFIPRR